MSEFENKAAEISENEVNMDEMDEVSGGARYKKLPAKEGFSVYHILPGDTLYALAKRFHTTIDALMACNPQITNRNLIRAGQYMYIPR